MQAQLIPSIDQVQKAVDYVTSMPYWAKAAVACFVCITLWRKLPQRVQFGKTTFGFPNGALWFVSVAVGIVVAMHFAPAAPADAPARQYRDNTMFVGALVGFLTRMLYIAIVGQLEQRFPWVKRALDANGLPSQGDSGNNPPVTGADSNSSQQQQEKGKQ